MERTSTAESTAAVAKAAQSSSSRQSRQKKSKKKEKNYICMAWDRLMSLYARWTEVHQNCCEHEPPLYPFGLAGSLFFRGLSMAMKWNHSMIWMYEHQAFCSKLSTAAQMLWIIIPSSFVNFDLIHRKREIKEFSERQRGGWRVKMK